MQSIQVNAELLSGCEYFNSDERRQALATMFGFDRRRVILGDGAVNMLAEECRRLAAHRVMLVHDPALPHLKDPSAKVVTPY